MVDDTWIAYELPILEYLVQRLDEPDARSIQAVEMAGALDLPPAVVQRSLGKLSTATPPYIDVLPPSAEIRDPHVVIDVTERARTAAKQWPSPERFADQLVAALNAAADREPDKEQQGRFRRTAAWFGGAGRDFLVDFGAAM